MIKPKFWSLVYVISQKRWCVNWGGYRSWKQWHLSHQSYFAATPPRNIAKILPSFQCVVLQYVGRYIFLNPSPRVARQERADVHLLYIPATRQYHASRVCLIETCGVINNSKIGVHNHRLRCLCRMRWRSPFLYEESWLSRRSYPIHPVQDNVTWFRNLNKTIRWAEFFVSTYCCSMTHSVSLITKRAGQNWVCE